MKRIGIYCKPMEVREPFVKALIAGAPARVDVMPSFGASPDDYDAIIFMGTKARILLNLCTQREIPFMYVDLGYSHRKEGYWRTSINAYQPVKYLMSMGKAHDRREKFDWTIKPWREPNPDANILVINSGASYSHIADLPLFEDMLAELTSTIRKYSGRHIEIRSKPVVRSLLEDIERAHVAVTYGSNAVVECIREGLPCIVLHDAPSLPICASHLSYVESPIMVNDERRLQWLANLAYCQWSAAEFASGEAWAELGPVLGL